MTETILAKQRVYKYYKLEILSFKLEKDEPELFACCSDIDGIKANTSSDDFNLWLLSLDLPALYFL